MDAVYIATIHPHHLEWVVHCAHAGKHVLCEKPLTMNLREAKQAQKIAQDKRVLLREAFMYRHHPQTQKVVDLVESGVIGIRGNRKGEIGHPCFLPDPRSNFRIPGSRKDSSGQLG